MPNPVRMASEWRWPARRRLVMILCDMRGDDPDLSTNRLRLRAPVPDDFLAYQRLMASPRARFMGGPFDLRAAWGIFCHDAACWPLFGHGALMIDLRSTGECVGQVGISAGPLFPEKELSQDRGLDELKKPGALYAGQADARQAQIGRSVWARPIGVAKPGSTKTEGWRNITSGSGFDQMPSLRQIPKSTGTPKIKPTKTGI